MKLKEGENHWSEKAGENILKIYRRQWPISRTHEIVIMDNVLLLLKTKFWGMSMESLAVGERKIRQIQEVESPDYQKDFQHISGNHQDFDKRRLGNIRVS